MATAKVASQLTSTASGTALTSLNKVIGKSTSVDVKGRVYLYQNELRKDVVVLKKYDLDYCKKKEFQELVSCVAVSNYILLKFNYPHTTNLFEIFLDGDRGDATVSSQKSVIL